MQMSLQRAALSGLRLIWDMGKRQALALLFSDWYIDRAARLHLITTPLLSKCEDLVLLSCN